MTRRYRDLALAALAAAVLLTVLARLPRRTPEAGAAPPAPAAVRAIALTVRDGALTPDPVVAHKGERLRVTVHNAGTRAARIALAGYADRVRTDALAPGADWTVEFTADLPGDDFTWTVDGNPAARFDVAGSHLVEGHR